MTMNVSTLPTVPGACRPDVFSPFAPNGGEEETITLVFVLGVCPRYAARIRLDKGQISETIRTCTELEVEPARLGSVARSLLG
ncbi:MAG: hypothetical protein ABSB83_05290 [Methanomassiliicoccales archaeon]|jgi:hypothetical protein